jgi:hypothetical protein
MSNTARLECDGALSDLILQAARQAIPGHVEPADHPARLRRPQQADPAAADGTARRRQQVTARAIADNAWDESLPLDRDLMHDLAKQARAIASAIESASDLP